MSACRWRHPTVQHRPPPPWYRTQQAQLEVEPGTALECTIDLQCTSTVFLKEHRVRLQVTSSNFPLWGRSPNTGEYPNRSSAMQVAHKGIPHDTDRPSHPVLPVVPK